MPTFYPLAIILLNPPTPIDCAQRLVPYIERFMVRCFLVTYASSQFWISKHVWMYLHGTQNVNKCATQPWFLQWVSLSISLSLFKYMAGAYTCSPQKSWDCTYTLGEFAFIYKCLVECYWDSHWRTHRACIGKHKFTHWVETGLIYWQWAKSDDQALTLLAYKTIVYEAFWSTNFLSSPDFRALTLPLRS